jgi:hypothetical protein
MTKNHTKKKQYCKQGIEYLVQMSVPAMRRIRGWPLRSLTPIVQFREARDKRNYLSGRRKSCAPAFPNKAANDDKIGVQSRPEKKL